MVVCYTILALEHSLCMSAVQLFCLSGCEKFFVPPARLHFAGGMASSVHLQELFRHLAGLSCWKPCGKLCGPTVSS